MCEYMESIEFMCKRKSLTDFINLLLPHDLEKNDTIISDYFLKQNLSINELHLHGTKRIGLQLDKPLQFRLSRIEEIEDFIIAEINNKEKMS